jgi:enamine deaminase RidA (YjgF/YER057c/UK114 family)
MLRTPIQSKAANPRGYYLQLAAILLLLSACSPARPETRPRPGMMVNLEEKKFITASAVGELEGFSQAVKVGKTVYISGQVALDSTGLLVGPGDLEAQVAQAFKNLSAILVAAGGTPDDVVRLDILVVGLKEGDVPRIHRAAPATFFPPGKGPAGSVIGIQSLPAAGLLVAINATAETKGLFPDREAMRRYQQ